MRTKEYYARLPFGQERRLNLGLGDTCPVCSTKRGKPHEHGCYGEECPLCGRPVVSCFCECLQPADEIRISMAIQATFTCLDDALNAGAGSGNRDADKLTPTDKAAMAYVMSNVPADIKAEFDRKFVEFFPDLKPNSINEQGELGYSTVDIAKTLGLSVDEVNEMAKAMLGEDGDTHEPVPLAGCH